MKIRSGSAALHTARREIRRPSQGTDRARRQHSPGQRYFNAMFQLRIKAGGPRPARALIGLIRASTARPPPRSPALTEPTHYRSRTHQRMRRNRRPSLESREKWASRRSSQRRHSHRALESQSSASLKRSDAFHAACSKPAAARRRWPQASPPGAKARKTRPARLKASAASEFDATRPAPEPAPSNPRRHPLACNPVIYHLCVRHLHPLGRRNPRCLKPKHQLHRPANPLTRTATRPSAVRCALLSSASEPSAVQWRGFWSNPKPQGLELDARLQSRRLPQARSLGA